MSEVVAMKKLLISVFVASVGIATAQDANAFFVNKVKGFATEITQYANHLKLVAQYAVAARQLESQITQLSEKQIRDLLLNQSTKIIMSDENVKTVVREYNEIMKILNGMKSDAKVAQDSAWTLYTLLKPLLSAGEKVTIKKEDGEEEEVNTKDQIEKVLANMKPEQKRLLTVDGRTMTSEQYMKMLQRSMDNVSRTSNSLTKQAEQIPQLKGNLSSLSFIAGQNIALQAAIRDMNKSLYEIEMSRIAREEQNAARQDMIEAESLRQLQKKLDMLSIGL